MSFTFNVINCETLDMVVETFPSRPFPARKQTVYKVPGRSGDLIVDENAFDNVSQEYEVYVNHKSQGLQANLTAIAAWLLGPAGYCELTDTYDPTIKRQARFVGGMEFINSLNKYGKATAVFDCKPQRWPATDVVFQGEMDEAPGSVITLPSSGLLPGYPLLEITNVDAQTAFRVEAGSLTIVVPSRGVSIAKIVINWETQSVYNAYNGSTPSNTSIAGSWGSMADGDTMTLTCEVTPRPNYKMKPRQYML